MSVVDLPDDLRTVIAEQVAEGHIGSEAQFLAEAITRFATELEADAQLCDIAEQGIADIERGEYITTTPTALMAELTALLDHLEKRPDRNHP